MMKGIYQMDILAASESILYGVSSSLLYPVVIGLVLLSFWVCISFGGFLRSYRERRKGNSFPLNNYRRSLESEIQSFGQGSSAMLTIGLERLLQTAELEIIKSLDKIRFVIRVGPALGLMGTLIPMGISLSSLAQGDMPKMASSMVTAFTTTVVGLACGVAAYLILLVKEKWVKADMREMEYLTELTLEEFKEAKKDNAISQETKKV